MCKLPRTGLAVTVVAVTLVVLAAALATVRLEPVQGAQEEPKEPPPPKEQMYTGAKRCASCHFQQFMSWKKTKHSKSFDLLTEKYENDPKCLKCHTTGYGEPSGYKEPSDTSLQGTTCEACHGPGSKHEEACQAFAKKKKLSEEEEKLARDTIWRMLPKNVCVECHVVQGHGESETPEQLRSKE